MNTLHQYNSGPVYCSSIVLWATVVKGSAEGARGWRRERRRVDDSFNNSVTVSRCHQKPAAAVWSCGCAGSRCVSSDRRLVCVPVQTASTGPAEPAGAETAVQEPASTSRTTRAERDNCLSWLSDAHGTKRILSDLYFAPLLHPKSQTPAGATSVYRIWMLDLLPWQQCVCFFLTCFHGKLCFCPSKMWRRFSIGAELTHNTQDAKNGETGKHSGHVVAGGWLSFCSLGVWQSINLSLQLNWHYVSL